MEKGTFFKVQVSPEARGLLRTLKRAELGNFARDLNQVFGFVANQTTRPAAVDVEHALERISIVVPIDASEIAVWLGRLIDAGVWDAKENGRLGFIDMLLLPACWNLKPKACQVLLVDEFQDLTPLQFELVRKSAEQGARIVLVGDSNQSIYGFAGATGNAFEWVRQLPGNVRSFGLPFSWRCARAIVRKANGIVPTIRPAESAPEGIVQEVSLKEMYEAVKPGDLVLSRFNAPLIRIFLGLLSRSVPVLLRGNDIEKSLVRALREIGESSGFAYSGFDLFASRWFDAKVEKARGNRALIRSLEDNFEAVGICHTTFRAESIFELITQVQKVFGDMRKDEEDRRITNDVIWLSSIHRSKGLQAKRVWVMDGKELPLRGPGMSRAEIETENNVAYVAFTRAQTFLGLVSTDAGANEGRR